MHYFRDPFRYSLGRFASAILFVSLTPAAERPLTGLPNPDFRPLDEAVLRFMDTLDCQAATAAVSRAGNLLYSRGYGWRDERRKKPTQPDTLFRIASVTKPITAAVVRQFIRDGKLTLETRAIPLLSLRPYNGKEGDPRLRDITVGQLLEHKGGWDRDKSFDPVCQTAEVERALRLRRPATATNIIEYMLAQPLQFTPGERSAYSNFGYVVLGRVLEKVASKSYEALLQEQILGPLAVTDVKMGHGAVREQDAREVWYPVPTPFPPEVTGAAGGLIASAPALCRILGRYWIGGEWIGQPRLPGQRGSYTFFGGQPGTMAMARQRPDGLDVVVLFNGRREKSAEEDKARLEKAVEEALEQVAAGSQEHFAAVWEKGEARKQVVRHGLTTEECQRLFEEFRPRGFRPRVVTCYPVGAQDRWAVVLQESTGADPLWESRHGLSPEDFQMKSTLMEDQGFRNVLLNGYASGSEDRYVAIWEKTGGPPRLARTGLSAEDFQKALERYRAQGYHPVWISAFVVGGLERYAVIWDNGPGPTWTARTSLTAAELTKSMADLEAKGYRPVGLSVCTVGGIARYSATWEKDERDSPAREARFGLTGTELQKVIEERARKGFRLVTLSAASPGATR